MKSKYCLLTNDVETTSILNHRLCDKTGEIVLNEGMPALLELYEKYQIKTTFFFTGYIAEKYPDIVKMIVPYGHEVASHGYSHRANQAFDILPLKKQIEHLKKSKRILEDISGQEVISFRAPSARVNKDTAIALKDTGFKIDSSVASQRFDMFLSFGSLKKLNWLLAPRLPYYTDPANLWKSGNGTIFEIPISAFLFPYIGTTMRILPNLTKLTRQILHFETKLNSKPIVFVTHPNEYIEEKLDVNNIERRSTNFISYLLGDVVRHKLKIRNLGKKALPIYQNEIKFFNKKCYNFITCKEYYNNFNKLKS